MVVLSAIGRFFKKIWDWIKQTAWIQPLLIVGIIFGIIFSIGPIVKAIGSAKDKAQATEHYFATKQVSMNGGKDSRAYQITDAIYKTAFEDTPTDTGVGTDKFFFVIVKKDCPFCAEYKEAFRTVEEKINGKDEKFKTLDGKPFKLVSIFADEGVLEGDKEDETLFAQYLKHNASFFSEVSKVIEARPFYNQDHTNEEDLANFYDCDGSNMVTPTIMLVELNPSEESKLEKGVTEIIFGKPIKPGYNVDGAYDLARYLIDCWNHTGDFKLN